MNKAGRSLLVCEIIDCIAKLPNVEKTTGSERSLGQELVRFAYFGKTLKSLYGSKFIRFACVDQDIGTII